MELYQIQRMGYDFETAVARSKKMYFFPQEYMMAPKALE
jgi:hypothetical protein